ncbi:MAG: STAS domain-containing protein [Candidatus Tumulicola sp.]
MKEEGPAGSYDAQTNTVALAGEWDLASKEQLRRLTDRLQSNRPATVDLTSVEFIDSSVINELLSAHGRLSGGRTGRRLRLLVRSGHIARLLDITGMDRIMDVERTESGSADGS